MTIWGCAMTILFSYLLYQLNHTAEEWMPMLHALIEGFSGGTFLATIAGTMIPRFQYDAYCSAWEKEHLRMIGAMGFVGVISIYIVDQL